MEKIRILRGDIAYNISPTELQTVKDGYLVTEGELVRGVFEKLPEAYQSMDVENHEGQLILPGFVDLHVHAPQYTFRGMGMNMELLPWLNCYTFPEEAKYENVAYAENAYAMFAEDLRKSATTRAAVFGTIHVESTICLMECLERSGIIAAVGKVNMDRNAPEYLCESTSETITETNRWLEMIQGRFERVTPILTPRFIPSCSNEAMEGLSQICQRSGLAVQSHLSENVSEIEWVQQLHPDTTCYAHAYEKYGLFGNHSKAIMAHCVYSDQTQEEMELLQKNSVWVAHCPESNLNLASGIAPVRKLMECGVHIGLGTDIAAGTKLSLFDAMAHAIQVSKMRWLYVEKEWEPLTVSEAFYLATVGGGSFFGKVGTFLEGYEFDAVVLDDREISGDRLSILERLERLIYLPEVCRIVEKYVKGRRIDAS